jgi:hypothetical protein
MTTEQKKWYSGRRWMTVMFAFGLGLVAFALIQMVTLSPDAPGYIADYAFASGCVMTVVAGARMLEKEPYRKQDERTRRIGAWGLSYSWFITFLALFGVFWLDYFGIASPDAGTLSVVFILLMGISARLFQWYLFRQGDVS